MASITHAACRANKGCKDARQHVGCDYRTLYGGVLGRVTSPEAGKGCQPVMVTNSAILNIRRMSAPYRLARVSPVTGLLAFRRTRNAGMLQSDSVSATL